MCLTQAPERETFQLPREGPLQIALLQSAPFHRLSFDQRNYFRMISQLLRFVSEIVGSTPMQCPPTSPGRKSKKFHLVPAAFRRQTDVHDVENTANSFINAIFKSLRIFDNLCSLSNSDASSAMRARRNNFTV